MSVDLLWAVFGFAVAVALGCVILTVADAVLGTDTLLHPSREHDIAPMVRMLVARYPHDPDVFYLAYRLSLAYGLSVDLPDGEYGDPDAR